ncbi:MAG TPA: membrane protein insertion efficiency factor YidD [Candidatus Paceibacterota bacterium]|nr:membrane protein insertion efficiency factor YidD [Candidatus Paceibacterota bacterium]
MKSFILRLLSWYQFALSPDQGLLVRFGLKRSGNVCVFYPSCSEYAILAVQKYGAFRGIMKSLHRISRCHPWQKEHIDFP